MFPDFGLYDLASMQLCICTGKRCRSRPENHKRIENNSRKASNAHSHKSCGKEKKLSQTTTVFVQYHPHTAPSFSCFSNTIAHANLQLEKNKGRTPWSSNSGIPSSFETRESHLAFLFAALPHPWPQLDSTP